MKKRNLLWIIGALTLGACSSNEPDMPDKQNQSSDPYIISLDEALQNAEREYDVVYGENTRADRKPVSTEVFGPKTRAQSDSLHGFYIVNYDQGFAMLSADRRRPGVYAISDEGSMHLADTIDNKGLSWYLNEYASVSNLRDPYLPIDTAKHINPPKPDPKQKIVIAEPMIKGFMSKFHQRNPYNLYCKTSTGEQALVGCVPLAVGTVMAYYKWPMTYQTYKFDWNSMYSSSTNILWARLFEVIGRPENIKASYGKFNTSAEPYNIPHAMSNMGYKNARITPFDKETLESELKQQNPVLCGGQGSNGGHRWVIDGGYTIRILNQAIMVTSYSYYDYYHCVWGWGGNANGYFLLDTNSYSIGGNPYEPDSSTSGSAWIYSNLSIVYGYKPNK